MTPGERVNDRRISSLQVALFGREAFPTAGIDDPLRPPCPLKGNFSKKPLNKNKNMKTILFHFFILYFDVQIAMGAMGAILISSARPWVSGERIV